MTDRDRLRELAEKATPGPWDYWDIVSWDEGTGDQAGMWRPAPYTERANAELIAAASPDVILALLEERRVLRGRIEGLYIRGFETPLLRLKDDAYNAALDDVLALLGAAQEKGETG